MGTWMNNDGLYIKFGATEGAAGTSGAFEDGVAGQTVVELNIGDLTDLGTAAAIQDDNVFIPAGYTVTKVELINTTAATSGGSAVLNVGLIRKDRSTELDYDGLIAAGALATFNALGETVTYTAGSTGAGALVGTVLVYPGYLTADYDTAAFTAGAVKIRVYLQKV